MLSGPYTHIQTASVDADAVLPISLWSQYLTPKSKAVFLVKQLSGPY